MSATPDSTLDDPQQVIAELQRALAERTAERDEALSERDEALARETATAEVLQVINSSPGDLGPVFEAILEKAHALCGVSFGSLLLYDGGRFHAGATRGLPEPLTDLLRQPFPPDPDGPLARLLAGERFYQIGDQAELLTTSLNPRARATFDLAGVRTVLWVPLHRDEALLGAIVAYRQEVRPFTDKQISLLQNFAAQAVIAMENARLVTETREALEQQTATAQVLGVINSSPGDLAPVFDAMLEKATGLCEAAFGVLRTWNGNHFHFAAAYGHQRLTEWARTRPPIAPGDGSPLGRILGGEAVVRIVDAPSEYETAPGFREMVEISGMRSAITVALRKEDTLVGSLTVYRQEVRPFTDKQIALLENFAAQAVIAIENARLITETQEALEQQTATAEVLGVINSSPGDLGPVFDAILEKAHALCGAVYGGLMSYDGEEFRVVAAHGEPQLVEYWQQAPFRPPEGSPLARVMHGEAIAHIADAIAEDTYRDAPMYARVMDLGGVRTFVIVPLRKDDALLGVITAYRQEVRPFTDKQIALLQNFAAQAVIAIENARLITETREALEQQTATAEVLGVINSSPGDLAPVFVVLLEKAMQVCDAAFGIMNTYDGERFHTVAVHCLPPALAETYRHERPPPGPQSPLTLIAQGKDVVSIDDLTVGPGADLPRRRILIEQGGARSWLAVALRKDGTLLGTISAYRTEVRPFSEKQVVLLQNFASQAVIAMENARLLGELRQRTDDLAESLEYQTAISDVLKVISRSTFDLQPVLDTLCETAARLCDASTARIALQRDDSYRYVSSFVERAISPEWDAMVREMRFTAGRGTVTGRALLERQTVHVADIAAYPEHAIPETFTVGRIRTLLAVPLLREDELIGVITLSRTKVDPFMDRQIELVRTFADQAVIAIENARLLGELHQRTDQITELNRSLEERVAEQVDELGRVGRLKRFLAPQLAELIVSQHDERILESHRREIVVVFCDLRGYTAFTETAEPEEVLDFLRQYHGALGPLVSQFEGTLDQFSGDGIMVFFNDPVPCPDPAERAVKMAVAMREVAGTLITAWRRRGRMLGFGAGIAQGYATLGQIGFADRSGYTAIGTVCNLAARLCAEAKDGQILIAQLVAVAVEETSPLEEVGELTLKGLTQPVVAYNVPLAAIQPALRVIEGGSPQTV